MTAARPVVAPLWTSTFPATPKQHIRPARPIRRQSSTPIGQCGAPGLLGVKLGSEGALLSPRAGQYERIAQVAAPGPVVDTTGAGDCFYAGLLTGLLRGMSDRGGRPPGCRHRCLLCHRAGCHGRTAGLSRDGPPGRIES